ncbi:MAG TPA: DUF87 domain-containing protein [Candidatus Nanoarchaeia archaeon]|nr:DUF87 domain-containing protein [Candidatus Nanoarchaeia archaeon]
MNTALSVEDICRKLKPVFGKKIDEIYMKYAMAESREEKDDIAHLLSALYQKNLNELLDHKVLLEPPKEKDVSGEYPLASVSYSDKKLYPFSLRERDWCRHVCITGMSGSGKTTLAFNILQNFIDHDKPFLVFDWKKSFRPLMLYGDDVMVFTIGNDSVSNLFKMNINQPPKGVDPKEWINVLCDLLAESFFASYGVHKVLLETLDEAFTTFGVYEGSNNYPTWDHIKWYLEEKFKKIRGRESGWVESAMRIASVLTFGNFGKTCTYKGEDSLTVEDLLDKKVILELNTLSSVEKKFFCEFVLTYIYKMKKASPKVFDGSFDHAILVDEAHNIFLKEITRFTKESVTDMVYREMREYGTSLICLDQHISKLSDTVKGNSACSIAFQQQLPADIWDATSLMLLKDQKNYLSMLPVGSAIVKLSERYTSPFLIEVAPVPLRSNHVTDEQVVLRTKTLVMGMEVEKGKDKEFAKALVPEQKPVKIVHSHNEQLTVEDDIDDKEEWKTLENPKISERELEYEIVVPEKIANDDVVEEFEKLELIISEKDNSFMSPCQKILYNFVSKRLMEGGNLSSLENELEMYKEDGKYNSLDVSIVINQALKDELSKTVSIQVKSNGDNVTTLDKGKIYKETKSSQSGNFKHADNTQEMFLSFLRENPSANVGTVEIYKRLGLSSRKGDKIKSELLNSGLIIVEERKNDKGWKKIIKLA